MTYFSPIDPNNPTWGLIGLQLNQMDYDQLIPSTVLEKPYEISFIAVYEKSNNDLIWNKTAETSNLNATTYMADIFPQL